MQPIENKVISRIYGKGRGWAFFKKDFVDLGSAAAIDKSLSRLAKTDSIRRVMRGVYDHPAYSKLLKEHLPPDIDQVANVLARKFGWTIQVSGNSALNILGLSTQVPTQYLYLSDGRSCSYQIGRQKLRFKKSRLKELGLKYSESALLVQAIRALDKHSLSAEENSQIYEYFSEEAKERILKDARYTTSWIYEEIKRIFRKKN